MLSVMKVSPPHPVPSPEGNGTCRLANLTFLEDPTPGSPHQSIMARVGLQGELPHHCRGGTHCCRSSTPHPYTLCSRNNLELCGAGEGDCDSDADCAGSLICGSDNCATKSGGLWDPTDDCCEKRCSASRPCQRGGGPCQLVSDCQGDGLVCGLGKCGDPDLTPDVPFLNFSDTIGLTPNDGCCVRRCRPDSLCKVNEVGCIQDSDCQGLLFCNTTAGEGVCSDVNECTDPRFADTVANTCMLGMTTRCVDTIGSFGCVCLPGYTDFKKYYGCTGLLYFSLKSQETGMYLGMELHIWTNDQWASTRGGTLCGTYYTQANGAIGQCTRRDGTSCCSSRSYGSCSSYNCDSRGQNAFRYTSMHSKTRYEVTMLAKCGNAIEWRWKGNMLQNKLTGKFLQVVEETSPEVLTVTSTGSSATQLPSYMGAYSKKGFRNGHPQWLKPGAYVSSYSTGPNTYLFLGGNNTWMIGRSTTTEEGVVLKTEDQGEGPPSTGWLGLEAGSWKVDPDLVVLGKTITTLRPPPRLLHPAGQVPGQFHLWPVQVDGGRAGGVRRAVWSGA